jgi:ERF superfamily
MVRRDDETSVVLGGITRAALDPNVDVAKLERLLAIQERLLADQRRTAFMASLARLQEKLPQIAKSGTILDKDGRTRNRFAKIEDIDVAIRPLCAEEGFSISFDSKAVGNVIEFTGTLHHREGHAETKTISLPVDNGAGRNAVQSVGSTTSYARRYLLGMHLNLVTRDEDDDGAGGKASDPITASQADEIRRLLGEVGGDTSRFLRWLGVESVDHVRLSQYGRAIKFIEEKKRQKGAKL